MCESSHQGNAFIYIERDCSRCIVNDDGNASIKAAQNESVSVIGC